MRRYVVAALAAPLLGACSGSTPAGPAPTATVTTTATATATATVTADPAPTPATTAEPPPPDPGTVPPAWLGTRVLPETAAGFGETRPTPPELRKRRFTLPDRLPPLPGEKFASDVRPVPDDVLARSTWHPGCPVRRTDLRWVRLTFWGFDDARHTGELLVHAEAASDLVEVFRRLYDARFPIEEMRITRADELDAPPTGDGNNTGAFVCRPTTGGTSYSEHAYGLAVDINPFQNPYEKGDLVLPELASAYLHRDRDAPGMIRAGDVVTEAFAAIGWGWGGAWRSLKDYQHFSRNNR